MNAIKRGFKLLGTKSSFEKDIIKLLCSPDLNVPSEKLISRKKNPPSRLILINFLALLLVLKDPESNSLSKSNIKTFFEGMKNIKRWEDAAKFLIVTHQAIYDEASGFVQEFAVVSMDNILNLPNNKEEFKLYVRCGLMKYYYRYLKKLAECYYSFRKCRRYTAADFYELLSKNDSQIILQFTQIKELVEDFFVSSTELQNIPVMQMIGELMLRDCIEMYNLLSYFISKTIEKIFDLPDELALMLDTVYSDLIRLYKSVSSFYDIKRSFLGMIPIKQPIYYLIEKDFNKKEELYINSVRKRHKTSVKLQPNPLFTLPDKPSDFFKIDDEEENHQNIYYPEDSERKDDDRIELERKNSKAIINEKKHNFERETLLTSEDKEYFDDDTHQTGQRVRKRFETGKNITNLTSILSPKQINGTVKTTNFSKIQNIDL